MPDWDPQCSGSPLQSGGYKGKEYTLRFVLLKGEGPLMQTKLLCTEAETPVKELAPNSP